MEKLFILICLIGFVAVGIPLGIAGAAIAFLYWWAVIPILFAFLFGLLGFFFGIGLDVVILVIYFGANSFISNIKEGMKGGANDTPTALK